MNAKQRRVARRTEQDAMRAAVGLLAPEDALAFEHFVELQVHRIAEVSVSDVGDVVLTNPTDAPIAYDLMVYASDDWDPEFSDAQPIVPAAVLPPDTVATLLDLARAGHEADFRWLAASAGVTAEEMNALWTGTVARVTR